MQVAHPKRTSTYLLWVPFLLLLLIILPGCDSTEGGVPVNVTLSFKHNVGGQALALNKISYTNAAGNEYGVTKLEYILTDLALITDQGETIPIQDQHYISLSNVATHSLLPVVVSSGKYTGVAFTLGVKGSDNVFGNLPNLGAYANMEWPAQLGGGTDRYHNMRLEGNFISSGGEQAPFLVHTGPTDGADNSVTYTLPIDVELDDRNGEVELTMNVGLWFSTPNTYNFEEYPGAIMGNQDAQTVLKANAANVFSARGFIVFN